jgi:hypothetical protein
MLGVLLEAAKQGRLKFHKRTSIGGSFTSRKGESTNAGLPFKDGHEPLSYEETKARLPALSSRELWDLLWIERQSDHKPPAWGYVLHSHSPPQASAALN